MAMTPRVRKFALTVHVVVSVGWLGSVVAYLALAIVGFTSQDAQVARACYRSMAVIGWFVIIPFSLVTLVSGLVEAVSTRWGLVQHWWVLAKVLFTVVATAILLRHIPAVVSMAAVAAESTLSPGDFRAQRLQLVLHAIGGLLVLLTTTVLSIYKPWGMTPFARRKENQSPGPASIESPLPLGTAAAASSAGSARAPRWVYVVGIHAVVLGMLFVVIHLAGGGLRSH